MKLIPIEAKGCENLYRHPKTQIIYLKIYRAGKGQVEKSTYTTTLSEAKRIADDYRVKFLGTSKINRGKKLCDELFPAWIDRKKISCRPRTISSMNQTWKHLEPYIHGLLPHEITAEWWETVYIPEKRKPTHSDKTGKEIDNSKRKFFNDRKWLSMFLLQLKRDGLLEKTPTLVDVDPKRAAGKVYPDKEIKDLLTHAGPDLKLQILMGVTMGMRIGEIMGMDWNRIDMKAKTIHLRIEDTKIKKARTFGISKITFELLKRREPKSGPLFPAPEAPDKAQGRQGNRRAWTTCRRLAGVTGRFHWLRHTFLTKAFKKSTNPALICHYAGLSLDEAQKTYLHFSTDDTRVVSTLVTF